MDFSISELNYNSVETIPGFEARVVFHRVCLRRVLSSLYTSDDDANLMILSHYFYIR